MFNLLWRSSKLGVGKSLIRISQIAAWWEDRSYKHSHLQFFFDKMPIHPHMLRTIVMNCCLIITIEFHWNWKPNLQLRHHSSQLNPFTQPMSHLEPCFKTTPSRPLLLHYSKLRRLVFYCARSQDFPRRRYNIH